MLRPVAPSGFAQPMRTYSIADGSILARTIACCSAWPPMVAPWVMLNAPRQLLQSGVRAVETMMASGIRCTVSQKPVTEGTETEGRRRRDGDGGNGDGGD